MIIRALVADVSLLLESFDVFRAFASLLLFAARLSKLGSIRIVVMLIRFNLLIRYGVRRKESHRRTCNVLN